MCYVHMQTADDLGNRSRYFVFQGSQGYYHQPVQPGVCRLLRQLPHKADSKRLVDLEDAPVI